MPERGAFCLAVCQLRVGEEKRKNLERARQFIRRAAAGGAELVVLPEMFNCPYRSEAFPRLAEEYPTGESIQMLAEAAAQEGIYLVGGSLPEREGERLYNTSFVFAPDGRLLARHRKLHLFDVDLASGLSFRESDQLAPGDRLTICDTALGRLGVIICYDLRFPELARLLALQGVQLLAVPAAFNTTTGPAHWEVLLRARAIDNQFFVVGASPARHAGQGYQVYGHSMVVDPWGTVLAKAGAEEEVLEVRVDLRRLEEVRAQLPLLRHRRSDLYLLEARGEAGPSPP
ncbi:MAG: carbon-nitrogen hydrolase family protein [Bacillota bacterium]|nr:carbon-nitrogen hydrolase family protein [Bacillota bacterium]